MFGAGGDRDAGKRPLMGAIAAENADEVIITDDNPRSENPQAIRAAILAAAHGAKEIGDRAEAIGNAIAGLAKGDVLLIAGKGHETGQIIGDRVLAVQRSRRGGCRFGGDGGMNTLPLWTSDAMRAAMRAEANGVLPQAISGISIDSRTLAAWRGVFRDSGAVHDGHNFVAAALKAGAALAVVEKAQAGKFASNAPLLVVDDVLGALVDLARAVARRARKRR